MTPRCVAVRVPVAAENASVIAPVLAAIAILLLIVPGVAGGVLW